MEHHSTTRNAAAAAAALALAGLALAGCKSSSGAAGSSGASASGGATTAPAAGGAASSPATGGTTTSSAASYFPIQQGNTWVYTSSVSGVGHGTVTNKMVRVVPVAGGQRVRMAVSESDDPAADAGPTRLTYIFHDNGSITVPVSQFGGQDVKLESGSVFWPSAAQLASGRPQHFTLVFDATIAGQTLREVSHVTVRGGASRDITVPAGTYHARAINESFAEKVDGVPVRLKLVTWVANGVGPVKTELLGTGTDAIPETEQELKSFTQG
jgi:hypothetical protein